jgi:hypothetical protein
MPEGIIRDPKQNPREKDFGIVYCNDLGGNFKYEKKGNNAGNKNRFLVAGDIVNFSPGPSDIRYYNNPITIDGIPIIGEIKNLKLDAITDEDNAPVINWYKSNGTAAMDNHEMKKLMEGNSDLPF